MQKTAFLLAGALASATATTTLAAPQTYDLDPGHSQIVFSYNHGGFSTTYGMFSGFGGQVSFDADAPENSSVSVSMPVRSMLTGWEKRFDHFMGADFFDAAGDEAVTFTSTGIEVTGEDTAHITGDLTINGVTKSVVLETRLNKATDKMLGFDATATLLRSDYGLGLYVPHVSDEVEVVISIEAGLAE